MRIPNQSSMVGRSQLIGAGVVVTGLGIAVAFWAGSQQAFREYDALKENKEQVSTARLITALGRIEPRNGIIKLAPPSGSGAVVKVARWLKEENASVSTGEILAELDSKPAREANFRLAEARVKVAKAKLDRVLSGSDPGEKTASRYNAEKARLAAELAKTNYLRARRLFEQKALSSQDLDKVMSTYYEAAAEYEAARGKLSTVSRVRKVEENEAQAEVTEAEAALAVARNDLNDSVVRSPLNGTLLKINAWPGTGTGLEPGMGLAELGDTKNLQIFAQVYEGDLPRIFVGEKATFRPLNSSILGSLNASVAEIGSVINQRDLFSDGSGSDINTRVVLVKLRVADKDIGASMKYIGLNVLVTFLGRK